MPYLMFFEQVFAYQKLDDTISLPLVPIQQTAGILGSSPKCSSHHTHTTQNATSTQSASTGPQPSRSLADCASPIHTVSLNETQTDSPNQAASLTEPTTQEPLHTVSLIPSHPITPLHLLHFNTKNQTQKPYLHLLIHRH